MGILPHESHARTGVQLPKSMGKMPMRLTGGTPVLRILSETSNVFMDELSDDEEKMLRFRQWIPYYVVFINGKRK